VDLIANYKAIVKIEDEATSEEEMKLFFHSLGGGDYEPIHRLLNYLAELKLRESKG